MEHSSLVQQRILGDKEGDICDVDTHLVSSIMFPTNAQSIIDFDTRSRINAEHLRKLYPLDAL